MHLSLDFFWRSGGHFLQHLDGQRVGLGQIFGILTHADPAERTESVVEIHRSHDVLYIGRIAEGTVRTQDIRTGPGTLQQEGVAIVKEIHSPVSEPVDGGDMAAERSLDGLLEPDGIIGHHLLGFLQAVADGIIAAGPGIVQRGLVGTQVDMDSLVSEPLPQVHDIADIGQGDDLLAGGGFADPCHQFVEVLVEFIDPALLETLAGGQGIDLRRYADHAGDVAGFRLGAGHTAETGGHKEHPSPVVAVKTFGPKLFAGRVHDGDGRAVDDALRADVHIGTGRHLAVLGNAERVESLPVVRFGIVGNDHAVGDDHTRGVLVGREKTHRETGVHGQGLLVGHVGQILHGEAVLRPVLEDGAVAAVGDEFVRVLGDAGIQVVLDHGHDGGCLAGFCRVFVNGAGVHLIVRAEPVHVDAAVALQFFCEFGGEDGVVSGREIAQGVLQGQDLFLMGEDIFAFGCMVDGRIVGLGCRQDVRNARQDFFLELIHGRYAD